MKLVPLGDRVVLKQAEPEEKTQSGIILTTQSQEKPQQAEVIYSIYAGNEVKLDGEEYIIVRQNDILAVVE